MAHRTREELDAGLADILAAPTEKGTVTMVVRRPAGGEREILGEGHLCFSEGLAGDNWNVRGSSRTSDGASHPDMQLNVISSRVIGLLAGSGDVNHRALAGDQLHLDLDITESNLPPGTRLTIGDAVIEVTDQPHRGCVKFSERFGSDARSWVNAGDRDRLRLRGLNARVVVEGAVRPGDIVTKLRSG